MSLTAEYLRTKFPKLTDEMIAQTLRENARLELDLNPRALWAPRSAPAAASPAKRMRQSARPLMNELEAAWFLVLKGRYPNAKIHPQAKSYRLARGHNYRPDFTAMIEGRECAWECKGQKAFRGGFENLKVAATTYPEIAWTLVWRVDGEWQTQEVLP